MKTLTCWDSKTKGQGFKVGRIHPLGTVKFTAIHLTVVERLGEIGSGLIRSRYTFWGTLRRLVPLLTDEVAAVSSFLVVHTFIVMLGIWTGESFVILKPNILFNSNERKLDSQLIAEPLLTHSLKQD